MKKIYPLILAIAFILAAGLTACLKTNNSLHPVFLSAKINGSQWKAQTVTANKLMTTLTIDGVDTATHLSKGHLLILYIFNYNNTTGTFKINDTDAKAGFDYGYGDTAYTGGTIVITKADSGFISGTFNFNTTDGKKITDGAFNVKMPM